MITKNSKKTEYVLSLSYGKDSLACLGAIKLLGLPLDRIIHAEVWATNTIPADLPPMVEFKAKADAIIKERYGIAVEHISAVERERDGCPTSDSSTKSGLTKKSTGNVSTDSLWCGEHGVIQGSRLMFSMPLRKATYETLFYRKMVRSKTGQNKIYGFPHTLNGGWCHRLKEECFQKAPLHKELTQILCNTSGLPQTSQKESNDILAPV